MSPERYAASHADPVNLLIHLVAVPLFWLAALTLLTSAVTGSWLVAAEGLLGIGISMGLQGFGHKREPVPPEPFTSPRDFVTRIFTEQFHRFPRFVLSGGWWRNFRQA